MFCWLVCFVNSAKKRESVIWYLRLIRWMSYLTLEEPSAGDDNVNYVENVNWVNIFTSFFSSLCLYEICNISLYQIATWKCSWNMMVMFNIINISKCAKLISPKGVFRTLFKVHDWSFLKMVHCWKLHHRRLTEF